MNSNDVTAEALIKAKKEISDYKFAMDESCIVAITDDKGIIVHANESFCKISQFPLEELIGQNHRVINSGFHPKEFFAEMWMTIQNGKIWRGEIKNKAKDGTFYWVDTTIVPVSDESGKINRYFAIRKDITEIKRIKDERQNILKENELVLSRISDGVVSVDNDWRYTFLNDAALSTHPFTREETIGKVIWDVHPEMEGTVFQKCYQDAMHTKKTQEAEDYYAPMGIWFSVKVYPSENGLTIFYKNITERKKSEQKILKANRLYKFLSNVNRSIVKVKNEKELLDNTCTIATEVGQFRIAYFGMLDENQKLKIVSIKGERAGIEIILNKSASDLNDPVFEHSPSIQALKNGSYCLNNNVQEEPSMVHWKEELVNMEVHSLISLPIFRFGEIIGVFSLLSGTTGFFDTEEIELLKEAIGDISFTLENFEKENRFRKTEDLLLKSEKRFRALIENSSDMKTLTEADGKVVYASPSITKTFGYLPDEFLNLPILNFFHPDDLAEIQKNRINVIESPGKIFYFRYRFKHKNGSWIWCEGSMTSLLNEPSVKAIVSNFRDVSEKIIIEEKQEFARNNLNALINNTNDLMWSIDRNYNLITFNTPFRNVVELHSGKSMAIGESVFKVSLSQEQTDLFQGLYQRAFSGESFTDIQYIESPAESWVETSFYPIKKGEEVIGTACHSRDISQRKKAEIEREKMTADIIQRNENFEQFTYIVSHNLRAPIARILGISNILKTSLSPEDKTKTQQYLFRAVENLDEIVTDLNKILKTKTEISGNKETIYFNDVLNDIESSINHLIENKGVKIETDFSAVDRIVCIKSYIQSIFYNLITNSIKYRQLEKQLLIRITSKIENKKIILSFSDNGIGIDLDKNRKNIFGLYQRFTSSTDGKGLGLFMVKTQVNAIGGSINVQSKLDKGTEFTIEIPT